MNPLRRLKFLVQSRSKTFPAWETIAAFSSEEDAIGFRNQCAADCLKDVHGNPMSEYDVAEIDWEDDA